MDNKEDLVEEETQEGPEVEESELENLDVNEELEAKLEEKETELEEITNRLLRLQADFNNYKNRSEKEKSDTIRYASEKLMIELLPILDNFERALVSESEEDGFYEGVKLIYTQILTALSNNGLSEIEALGQPFDPNIHHAVVMEESDEHDEQTVLEVLQKGYKLNDKTIRPSMVKVSK